VIPKNGKGNAVATTEKVKNEKRLVSATMIILAALVIIVAANAIVWKNRLGKNSEINTLNTEIAHVSRELRTLPAPSSDLQARLIEANANLTTAQKLLPVQFDRNDLVDYMIILSRECQVEVLPITSQGWVTEKVSQSYPVLKLTGTISGTFTHVNDFIYKLQHGKYKALLIPEISYTRQSSPDSSGSFSGEKTMVIARFSVNIYARVATADKGN
jgi:hypothetical protein